MMRKPPHPGFGIRDLIEDAGMSVTDAARKLGVTRQALNNLVNARAGISPEMAIRLEKVFGGSAEQWLRIQTAYELAEAREREDEITEGLIPLKKSGGEVVIR
jgi:addiction module HigA family antidote